MSTIFPLSASVGQVFDGYEFDGTRWNIIGIDLTANYLEESSASIIYLDKISASTTYATISTSQELSNKTLIEPQIEISGPLSVLSYPQNSGYFDDSNFNLSYGGLLDVSYVSFDSNTNILSLNIPNFPTFLIPVFVAGAYVSGQSLSNKVTSYSAFTADGSSVTVDLDELFGPGTKNLSEIVLKFWYGSTPSTAAFSIQSSTITISSTELSYLDGVSSDVQNQLNSKLSIVSASSTYATISYVDTEIANIDALPLQTGNNGKFLTTNGSIASWATVDLTNAINTASAAAVTYLVDSAPNTLDTLNELAAALGDDQNYATTITNALASKLNTSTASTTYLTQANASSTYLTQSNASSIYLTQSNASSTYLLQSSASNIYATISNPVFTSDIKVDGQINLFSTASSGYIDGYLDYMQGGNVLKISSDNEVVIQGEGSDLSKLALVRTKSGNQFQPSSVQITTFGQNGEISLSSLEGTVVISSASAYFGQFPYTQDKQIATLGSIPAIIEQNTINPLLFVGT